MLITIIIISVIYLYKNFERKRGGGLIIHQGLIIRTIRYKSFSSLVPSIYRLQAIGAGDE